STRLRLGASTGQADVVEGPVAQERPGMAGCALPLAEEELQSCTLLCSHCRFGRRGVTRGHGRRVGIEARRRNGNGALERGDCLADVGIYPVDRILLF